MNAQEWLDVVCHNVQDRARRASIRQELMDHLEDAKEDYYMKGYTEEEAGRMAVQDMGDPEEAAVGFNHVHHSWFEWKQILVLTVAMLIVRTAIFTSGFTLGYGPFPDPYPLVRGIGIFLLLAGFLALAWEKYEDMPLFYNFSNGALIIGVSLPLISCRWTALLMLTACTVILMLLLRSQIERRRFRRERRYLYQTGTVTETTALRGRVRFEGETHDTKCIADTVLAAGTPIVCTGIDGWRLIVEPLH